MAATLDPAGLRHGRVRGRYFRENFAQAGIDLAQIVPELITNADAAIAAAGRGRGRIQLRFGAPDPDFLDAWRRELRRLRVPALLSWRHEVVCADDGEGVDAAIVDRRLGALGVVPEHVDQRGLFGRGLRDVWLAQGAGRIQGVRAGRAVELVCRRCGRRGWRRRRNPGRSCDHIATKPHVTDGDGCPTRTSDMAIDQDQRGRRGIRRTGGDG